MDLRCRFTAKRWISARVSSTHRVDARGRTMQCTRTVTRNETPACLFIHPIPSRLDLSFSICTGVSCPSPPFYGTVWPISHGTCVFLSEMFQRFRLGSKKSNSLAGRDPNGASLTLAGGVEKVDGMTSAALEEEGD